MAWVLSVCGIAGQVASGTENVDPPLIRRMTRALAHRGPDGERLYFDQQCGLGHRRLSLIDLEGGAQPLSNEDGTVHVVSNSEIYNYVELTRELESRGHRFATASDTEVIVHLYEELGADCVDPLVGMFAFALWDSRQRTLLLARDRFGIKPLYYAADDRGGLRFASELKALLEDPRLGRQLDYSAAHQYFLHLTIPEPDTGLRNVRKLPAAHVLTWRDGSFAERAYWDLTRTEPASAIDEDDAVDLLGEHLGNSVALSLRSDAPVGVFLSGGVDSSLLTWLASVRTSAPLRTFSVVFAEPQFDEREFSRMVARAYGTEHQEIQVSPQEAADALVHLCRCLDEPFADSSAIPTYLLAMHARQSVKAVLTGEGSDELFAGSPWHVNGDVSASLETLMRPAAKVIFGLDELDSVYSPDFRAEVYREPYEISADLQEKLSRCPGSLERHLCVDLHSYLPSDLLMKTDRMTMRASLEARVPFLNHPFVEFAWRLPADFKWRDGVRKRILKQLGAGNLPDAILTRAKKGFAIPMDLWLWTPGDFRDLVFETLLDVRTASRGQFNMTTVRSMMNRHDRIHQFHGYQLWTLFVFEMWQRNFLDPSPRPEP